MSNGLTGTPEEAAETLANLIYAYRIVEIKEWEAARDSGVYKGSSIDERDAFMHLSLPGEVLNTARIYYGDYPGKLLVLKVDLKAIPGAVLRCDWVESRRAFFPHIIGGDAGYHIPVSAVQFVHTLTRDEKGNWTGFNLLE